MSATRQKSELTELIPSIRAVRSDVRKKFPGLLSPRRPRRAAFPSFAARRQRAVRRSPFHRSRATSRRIRHASPPPGGERSPLSASRDDTRLSRRTGRARFSCAWIPPFFGSSPRVATCQRAITPRRSSSHPASVESTLGADLPSRLTCHGDKVGASPGLGRASDRRTPPPESSANFTREKLQTCRRSVSRTRRFCRSFVRKNHTRSHATVDKHFTRFTSRGSRLGRKPQREIKRGTRARNVRRPRTAGD